MATSIARLAAIALLLAVLPAAAQIRRLPPVDESARDATLVAYLARLKQAVAARDRAAIIPLLHPDIKLGFGGDGGVANFTPDWPALQSLLAMGGAWNGAGFTIPYIAKKFPRDLDAFEYAAITGRGVRLRAGDSSSAAVLRTMSYEIVKVVNSGGDWWEVDTALGERGFVSAEFIAGPIGLRAIFQKDARGEWKMFALVSGD